MNFQTNTVTVISISNSVEEWRAILADDTAFKTELRAKLAELRASDDTRGNIAYSEKTPYRVDGDKIAAAAKKQNKKNAKRFLAHPVAVTGAFPCDQCDKTFNKQQFLNIHRTRMHKVATEYHYPVHAAGDASDE